MGAEKRAQVFDSQLKAERDYWIKKLSSERPASNLRLDFDRAAMFSGAKDTVQVTIPDRVSAQLNRITANSPFLLYTALLTALKICLHKYTGSRSIVVGSPARREDGGPAQASNVLPIISDIDPQTSFRKLLYQVRDTLKEDYARQSYPFDRIVEDLGIGSPAKRCPIFDVSLSLKNYHLDLPQLRNDITMTFDRSAQGVAGIVEYNSDLFRRNSIEYFAAHFVTLLSRALHNVDTEIGKLDMLTEAERRLLAEWNNTQSYYPQNRCVHELFEAQAANRPDAVALVLQDQRVTYDELNRRANQLAHYLGKIGVGPDCLVGILMERSIRMIVAVLGILKAGAAYVPLDPAYPQQRLAFMLQDCGAITLLSEQRLVDKIADREARTICLDAEWELISAESEERYQGEAGAGNLAYVIYTSGSTGRPKGVMVEHRGICNLVEAQNRAFNLGEGSRVLQFASLSFDASVSEIFTTLTAGATLDLGNPESRYSLESLAAVMERHDITTITLPPTLLGAAPPGRITELGTVVSAGEACTAAVFEKWSAGRLFINAYGPTEATVCATMHECIESEPGIQPIGKPMANVSVHVVDQNLNVTPVGVVGELCIAGVGVARGYLNRADVTAEKFVPDDFSAQAGGRLYRTGDVGRYRPDGSIEYVGRADHQVKLRGYRIELGEIEAALSQFPAVQDAVVLAAADGPAQNRLVAYIVPDRKYRGAISQNRLYTLPNDLKVFSLSKDETDEAYEDIFQEQAAWKRHIVLNDGDCILDVGANIGLFTLFVHQTIRDAVVYAFEPDPAAFEILRGNVDLHDLKTRLYKSALSRKAPGGALSPWPAEGNSRSQDVETLSSIMAQNNVERIDLLRIKSVKGGLEVLEGIRENDWYKISQIIISTDGDSEDLRSLEALLTGSGYAVVVERSSDSGSAKRVNVCAVNPSKLEESLARGRTGDPARRPVSLNMFVFSISDVRRFLEERLPEYMIPSAFVMLDELPLGPNGKIDRKALPAPDQTRRDLGRAYEAPRTPTERLMAEIWAEALGVEEVGVHDNFFELGGHSLLVTQVVFRVLEVFGVDIPVATVFESPTVAETTVALVRAQAGMIDSDDMNRILSEIEQLSDSEVETAMIDQEPRIDELNERAGD